MLQTVSWYLPSFFTASLLILTGCFGDWRNWRKYYPTILFIVLVSLFAYVLTYDHPLWLYHGTFLSPNRTMNELRVAFLSLPAIILLYLSFYPYASRIYLQIIYTIIFIISGSIFEFLYVFLGIITFHNDWHMWWSVATWFVLFLVAAIHNKNPPLAWIICVIFSVIIIIYFKLSLFE